MGASITSAVTSIQNVDNVGVQLDFTGAPVGTFAIQVSADYAQDQNGNVLDAGHWIALPVSAAAAGAANDIYFDLNQLSAPWIRVVYTRTSGTGVLNVSVTAKEI